MMTLSSYSKKAISSILALLILSVLLLGWIAFIYSVPMATILGLALVSPFLFFIPGFFVITKSALTINTPERIILSIFFSVALNGVALDVVEKIIEGLPPLTIAITIGIVNVAAITIGSLNLQRSSR